jgi:hypothetical protein
MDGNSLKLRRRINLSAVTAIKEGTSEANMILIEVGKENTVALTYVGQDRNEWIKALSDAMNGCNQSRVFGVALEDLMIKNGNFRETDIPPFIVTALDVIDSNGLEQEGIFRVSGSVLTIRNAKEAINQGQNVDFNSYDIYSVAGIVQTWLRYAKKSRQILLLTICYPENSLILS